MAKAIVVGAGIIGLSSALYLKRSGWDVSVIDKDDMLNNCSFGNMGYVCPSHFIPLATPGIIQQGLKWMLNSQSPFYVQPRLSRSLINWGLQFIKSASDDHVKASAKPLAEIAILSKRQYEEWNNQQLFDFSYQPLGLLEYFKTAKNAAHAEHTVDTALELGLKGTRLLDQHEAQLMEPQTELDIAGAIYFECDAQVWPNQLMKGLSAYLKNIGVEFYTEDPVKKFVIKDGHIHKVITATHEHEADMVVIAAGSWSREVVSLTGMKLPLVAGRGYSFTLENSPYKLNHPAILTEGRVAITPISHNLIRFGGTMEITSTHAAPNYNRVKGIVAAVKQFLPQFDMPIPEEKDIWYGFRPCSADGLPYIGRTKHVNNCIIATGHSMLGLSLGAATGKLVSELANETPTSMNLQAFDVHRFD